MIAALGNIAALGKNAHLFVQPHRRQELAWCFGTALGCDVATVEYGLRRRELSLVRRLRFLTAGDVSTGNRAGRCPDDHEEAADGYRHHQDDLSHRGLPPTGSGRLGGRGSALG
jgi:hypothetical protein